MELKDHIVDFLEYNHQTNQCVLTYVLDNRDAVNAKIESLLSHILNAHQIWNARIIQSIEHQVWQMNPWDQWLDLDTRNYKNSIEIIQQYAIETKIIYTNSKGEKFQNSVREIFTHLINHSTYHRAQIATELKNLGLEPQVTDYIMHRRLMI